MLKLAIARDWGLMLRALLGPSWRSLALGPSGPRPHAPSAVVSLAMLWLAATGGAAQNPAVRWVPPAPRTRVRVSVPFQVYIGRFVGQDANALRIEVPGLTGALEVVTLPASDIRRVEVSRPGPSRAPEGALIGLGAGAAAGVLVGAVVYLSKGLSCLGQAGCSRSSPVGTAALIGAAVGSVTGLLIGAANRPEEWVDAGWQLGYASPRARPSRGFAVTVSFGF